jgi:hypothetical protein
MHSQILSVGTVVRSALCALATLALGALAPAVGAASRPCSYQDLMPAYEKFAAGTSGLAPQQRAAAFVRDFAPRYPDYYAPEVFGDAAKLQAGAVRYFDPAQAAVVFKDVPPLTAGRLAALASVVGPQFAQQQHRFMQTFPDFNCHTMVELGVSLLNFDGHGTQFGNGKYHLLFGVDVIAMFHGPADMPAFFDH